MRLVARGVDAVKSALRAWFWYWFVAYGAVLLIITGLFHVAGLDAGMTDTTALARVTTNPGHVGQLVSGVSQWIQLGQLAK